MLNVPWMVKQVKSYISNEGSVFSCKISDFMPISGRCINNPTLSNNHWTWYLS